MKKKKICCITTVDVTLCSFVADAMYQFVESGYEVTLVCSDTTKVRKEKRGCFPVCRHAYEERHEHF